MTNTFLQKTLPLVNHSSRKKIGIRLTTTPKNPLPPYSLRTVSGPHTANFTANPTTTTVWSYLTVSETYQPRQYKTTTQIELQLNNC